jgi:hypothetical protein
VGQILNLWARVVLSLVCTIGIILIAALPSALLSTNTILEKLVVEEPKEAALP